jgi:hypothetical protein
MVGVKTAVSILGRLLQELSWEGNARHYRQGGRGFENVLTAEVFQALDFLPRTDFLGSIVRSLEGGASETTTLLAEEIEQATISLLPGDIFLTDQVPPGKGPLSVQPDGIITSPSVYCLLEAKRIKRGAFQREQLTREFLAVLHEAQDRRPLLLLVLREPPPIPVRGEGRLPIRDAVARWLDPVLRRTDRAFPTRDALESRIDSVLAYTTWQHISKEVEVAVKNYETCNPTLQASVHRLTQAVLQAIHWHS